MPRKEDRRLRVGVLGAGPIAQAAHFGSCTEAADPDAALKSIGFFGALATYGLSGGRAPDVARVLRGAFAGAGIEVVP